MGIHRNIGINFFPKQSAKIGKIVDVTFDIDSDKKTEGRIVRDDQQDPFVTLIELMDGRIISNSECQYIVR